MAYEYGHDCPFEAYITNLGKYNEGELVGEWVKFPTTSEDLQKVFERIGIGSKDDFGNPYEEWFISDYDCYVDGLYEMLGEYESLDELNYLAFFKKKPVIFFRIIIRNRHIGETKVRELCKKAILFDVQMHGHHINNGMAPVLAQL